jgi:hypothetical protein
MYLKIRLVLVWRCSKQNLIGGQKSTVEFQIKSPGQARPGRVDVHGARCADHTLPHYSGRMLSGSKRFLKPSSAAVPTAAANEQYYDDDDQKSGVVHIPLRALEVRNGAKAAAVPARPEYKTPDRKSA